MPSTLCINATKTEEAISEINLTPTDCYSLIIIRHKDKRTPKENGRNAACEENGAGEEYGSGGKTMFSRVTSRKRGTLKRERWTKRVDPLRKRERLQKKRKEKGNEERCGPEGKARLRGSQV